MSNVIEIEKGYKLTSMGVIPMEWSLRKIDDVFGFIRTNSLSRNKLNYEYSENNIFNIHYGDIHSTYQTSILDFDFEKKIPVVASKDFMPNNTDFLIEGDVVIADASEDYEGVGKAIEIQNIKGRKVLAGLHTFALRAKSNETALGFRTYIFKHPKVSKTIKVIATGTKVYGVSKSNFATLNIILPSLPEQQKIAEILNTWDEAITLTKTTIEELELRKKGLMQQIFSGELRLQNPSGKSFPDWKAQKLGHYLKVSKAKNLDLKYGDEDVLSVSGEFGIVNQIEFHGRSFAGASVANYGVVETGDIVYTKSPLKANPYGIIKVNKGDPGIVSTLYAIYKCKPTVNGEFVDYYFQLYDNVNRYLRPLVQKGTKNDMKINNEKVLLDKVLFPSVEEQAVIVDFFKTVDQEITETKNYHETLKTQKKGLMQKLLTGEVRVKID